MSETISFREIKLEGGCLIIRPERQDLGKAMAVVRKHKDKLYDLEVKEHRKKRSLDANAYAWVLINKIADALRITPIEIYRQAIQNVSGNYEVIPIKEEAVDHFKKVWEAQGLGWPCVDMGKSKLVDTVTSEPITVQVLSRCNRCRYSLTTWCRTAELWTSRSNPMKRSHRSWGHGNEKRHQS